MRKLILALCALFLALPALADGFSRGVINGSATGVASTPISTYSIGTGGVVAISYEYGKDPDLWYHVTYNYNITTLGSSPVAGFVKFPLPNSSTASARGASCSGTNISTGVQIPAYITPADPTFAYINITPSQANFTISCVYLATT